MSVAIVQMIVLLAATVLMAIPLGFYIDKVMNGERVFLTHILRPAENVINKAIGVKMDVNMSGRSYFFNVIAFSVMGLGVFFVGLIVTGINPYLAFNTASSFVTNTNWQAYSGESTLTSWQQSLFMTTHNFVSAGVGICVLYALIRALVGEKIEGVGNFYRDLTRSILYILLPLSVILTFILMSQGVVQTIKDHVIAHMAQGGTQYVPLGPAASQVAIKQLGTNGGGFFGTNSAFPFENPTFISNFFETVALILIPMALCFAFGRAVKQKRQGYAIFVAMFILMALALVGAVLAEYNYHIVGLTAGNMEGKETRFGIGLSALWGVLTTSVSNGSVNAMLDSFTPIGGFFPMLLMQLGEVVYGGVGCGLYGMLGFVILTVFIAGLMIGRTPEYLRKKIEPTDMKMAAVLCLTTPLVILIGTAVAAIWPNVPDSIGNPGIHAFSELLYGYTSTGANNGSAFAGLGADTPFLNTTMGICMILGRFIPIWATLKMADSMRAKSKIAESSATLRTDNAMFVGLLVFVVLLIGALSMFPALALGPIAESLH